MHIIFENVSNWYLPFFKALKYFKFKIFYLDIDANTEFEKNKIASKFKDNNIFPLPIYSIVRCP